MNVITLASRKGGAGKSTLTAHLAAVVHKLGRRCLIVDADPQGSLTLWHSMRADRLPALKSAARGIDRVVTYAQLEGYEWVFIDTAPTMWVVVQEAIRAATLVVIPARPGFFDVAAVRETVLAARDQSKPYAVVLNAAPARRDNKESPIVSHSRTELDQLLIPVWSGQITQRSSFVTSLAVGASPCEMYPGSAAEIEIDRLWSAIARSVDAINSAQAGGVSKRDTTTV
jgi:chromosome partitioning protein